MLVTWIGQGGLLFEHNGKRILIDPYLSDSVEKVQPHNRRRIPICEALFDLHIDVMVFTHDHLDHYDPETVVRFLAQEERITVLAPSSVWPKVRLHGGNHNYVLFDEGTQWSECGLRFSSVPAVHSDPLAIGVIVDDSRQRYYVTGDTLYSSRVVHAVYGRADVIFLPINGVGNNMNATDAARFAADIEAQMVVPMHYGMFDDIEPSILQCPNKRVLEVYQKVKI